MKKIMLFLAGLFLMTTAAFSQTCPTSPGSGVYVMFDTNYQVGTVQSGETHIRMCFNNSLAPATKITGLQFRVWYDKDAFGGGAPVVTSMNTSFGQYLQYVTNVAEGSITITLSYTGSSSTFNIPDGQLFDLKLMHSSSFWTYTSISDMKITGLTAFSNRAANIAGMDATLTLHNYGGHINPLMLAYHGTFTNVTGTPAKNLPLAIQTKPKTSGAGAWADFATTTTDINGEFAFNQSIDTTYYNARLRIQGDTLAYGNIVTTADAHRINDIILGNVTPTGFDYYASDVNGSNDISIADVYSVFGRIAGSFNAWPNNVKDVVFFSASEYATINGASSNYTSTIPGITNLTFDILPGQPDSVTFYVLGHGDANGTGYHMARMIPVEIVNPVNALNYIIDKDIQFDSPTPQIELNLPHTDNVEVGNLVNVPVKYLAPMGEKLGSMQFGLWYDNTILEFRGIEQTSDVSRWMTYLNPEGSVIDWGGYDPSGRDNLISDNTVAFTLKFAALEPKSNWTASPLWVTRKAAGGPQSQDYSIRPTEGLIQLKIMGGSGIAGTSENTLFLYPNPTSDLVTFAFTILNGSVANIGVYDMGGRKCIDVLTENFPKGKYSYTISLGNLAAGTYAVVLNADERKQLVAKSLIKQ